MVTQLVYIVQGYLYYKQSIDVQHTKIGNYKTVWHEEIIACATITCRILIKHEHFRSSVCN